MTTKTEQKAKAIIADQLDVEEGQLSMDSHFQDDLGADSLDMTEMLMAFEEEFGIEISDEEAQNFPTVGDVIKKLEELSQ